jgi:hypothetical protein
MLLTGSAESFLLDLMFLDHSCWFYSGHPSVRSGHTLVRQPVVVGISLAAAMVTSLGAKADGSTSVSTTLPSLLIVYKSEECRVEKG